MHEIELRLYHIRAEREDGTLYPRWETPGSFASIAEAHAEIDRLRAAGETRPLFVGTLYD